ncbi:hypothetical protein SAMN04487886_10162 [Clostridium sp. DSM 8431]|nr:hypothetical protein SAMN04487886_10162 [Clostridium sp. DSM 8431]
MIIFVGIYILLVTLILMFFYGANKKHKER